jgi:phosphoribosylanthranilate isomerase
MRTRVKICGITSQQDALTAVGLGADAIGLVFYPPSPRAVTLEQAADIVAVLPPFVTVVGLFVNAGRQAIAATLSKVPLDLLQFHGDESAADCAGHGRPYIKAIRMREGVDLQQEREHYADAAGLLLDTYKKGIPGGTGSCFEWAMIPPSLRGEVILAGGLTADTVEQAIAEIHPYAVDVSGGVERTKGVKDAAKIAAFMRGVERANQ